MLKATIIFSFLSFFLLTNCKNDCINNQIGLSFIGFPEGSVDTLILKKFVQNDSLNHFIDSLIITNKDHQSYYISNDTILVYGQSYFPMYIQPNYDWQIYLPATGRTVTISNIISPQIDISCWKCMCRNPIISFVQDGQLVNLHDSLPTAYIHN